MAMEPEKEPFTVQMQEEEVDVGFAKSAEEGDGLAFINVSGGNIDDPNDPKASAPINCSEESQTFLQRARANWDYIKAVKVSMTADLAPWTSFVDRKRFSVPQKSEVFGRIRTNLKVYYANYMMALGALAIWIMISNLYFVLAMLLSVGSYYYYRIQTSDGSTFVFRGKPVSPAQFYIFLVSFTLFLFWLTGGGSTMFWMIASALVVVFGHASFREAAVDPNASADLAFSALEQTLASRV